MNPLTFLPEQDPPSYSSVVDQSVITMPEEQTLQNSDNDSECFMFCGIITCVIFLGIILFSSDL